MDKVLIIDDDRFTQNVLQKALFHDYDVRTADNGDIGIKVAQTWLPNIILLDVEMPGRNGYEVCDAIKQESTTRDIPVIFVSSRSSVRERLLGFEVGGDDFLVKPCSKELLHKKLEKVTSFYKERNNLKQEASTSVKTALEAMATSFELGKAIRFVEKTYSISTLEQLGKMLMGVMTDLGLSASVMFKCKAGLKYYSSSSSEVAPLEMEILSMLNSEKRFTDFGCRTQINYPQVSLLIKNMPLDDRAKYGRIKDSVPFLLGATDAKIRVLDAEQALLGQNQKMSSLIAKLQETTESVANNIAKNQQSVGNIMSELTQNLSLELHKMGLEADQEEFVHDSIEEAAKDLHSLLENGDTLRFALEKTVTLLTLMAQEQTRIIDESLSVDDSQVTENVTDDIELF